MAARVICISRAIWTGAEDIANDIAKAIGVIAALLLASSLGLAACDDEEPTSPEGLTLVEVAQEVNAESGEFSTLLAAVSAAGLVDALSGDAQTTVFAPTDAAFAKLRDGGNFAAVAKEHSQCPSAAQGGDLGWRQDQVVPAGGRLKVLRQLVHSARGEQ